MDMQALILCGGQGRRLGFQYKDIPKCLVKKNNRPIIEYVLESLSLININKIIIFIGNQSSHISKIKSYLKNLNREINVKIVSEFANSTAEAVKLSESYLTEPFICLHGNVIAAPKYIKNFKDVYNNHPSSLVAMGSKIDSAPTHPRIFCKNENLIEIVSPDYANKKISYLSSLEIYYCPHGTLNNLKTTNIIDKTMFALTLNSSGKSSYVIEHKHDWFHLATPADINKDASKYEKYWF